jgi:hypothetical protein
MQISPTNILTWCLLPKSRHFTIFNKPRGGDMRKIVSREIVDDVVTSVSSPKGVTTFWLEKVHYDDGSSKVITREEITFAQNGHKNIFMMSVIAKRH